VNLWVRVYSLVESDGCWDGALSFEVTSRLQIVIHRTEASAREAAERCGGIVLEVAASSLKGLHKFDELLLVTDDSNDTQEEGRAQADAFITVCCKDIPYRAVAQSLSTGEIFADAESAEGETQTIMEFTKQGERYLDELSAALGGVPMTQ
jgi:hypothetical protein